MKEDATLRWATLVWEETCCGRCPDNPDNNQETGHRQELQGYSTSGLNESGTETLNSHQNTKI